MFSPDGCKIITSDIYGEKQHWSLNIWDADTLECLHTIRAVSGLEVLNVDLSHLHPDSQLSDESLSAFYEYGAITDRHS